MTATKARIISVILALIMILSLSETYAAEMHADVSGGNLLSEVAPTCDEGDFCSIEHIGEKADITNDTDWEEKERDFGDGEDGLFLTRLFTEGEHDTDLTLYYNEFLVIGNKKYDVKMVVESVKTSCNKLLVAVKTDSPKICLNTSFFAKDEGEMQPDSTDRKGSNEAEVTVEIFDSESKEPANLPGLYFAMTDLSGTANVRAEAWTIDGYTPSDTNALVNSDASEYIMYKGNTIYGTREDESADIALAAVDTMRSGGKTRLYYSGVAITDTAEGNVSGSIHFYEEEHAVNYVSDTHGTILGETTENVEDYGNPSGSSTTPDTNYVLMNWTCDKNVTLNNGNTITAGDTLTQDQVKKVSVREDLTFTAHHEKLRSVSYEWDGDHPDEELPEGKDDITPGSTYEVDTTYEEGTEALGSKDGKRGYYTFNGWDKSGTITIDEDTVIKGTWSFTPNVSVSYEWTGAHPDVEPPAGESDIRKGGTHEVDTTYTVGDEIEDTVDGKNGYWRFNGWDKSGFITVDEDTTISGTWTFVPNVDVTYEWSGSHPNVDLPEGETDIKSGSTYKVDTTITRGMEANGSKDGKNGYYTFNGWDKTGTITVTEDTVIIGTWTFTPNVSVSYEWDGEHPDLDPPVGEIDIRKGNNHTVDTSFRKGDEVTGSKDGKNGYWKFDGWDRRGIIAVNEDTVITGTWTFTANVSVTYIWDSDYPEVELPENEIDIKKGSSYKVDNTYKRGDEVAGTYDGKSGYWKFDGWNKTGTITVDEDTVISGTWTFTPNVNVTYEWVGDCPDVELPENELNLKKGSTYKVDNTYKRGDEVAGTYDGHAGYWRFNGWDKTGTITVDEDTVIKGTWTFTNNVRVYYEWEEDYPEIDPPEGDSNFKKGNDYKVDTTFSRGTEALGSKDGKNGYYTFNGWDKTGTIVINEDTAIRGSWTFTPNVSVTYEWDGDCPEIDTPENEPNIKKGSSYKVDNTYKKGDEVAGTYDGKNGYWKFNGWNRTGTITVTEDTVISGTWTFTPNVSVSYEWDGEHPDTELPENEPNVKKGSVYTVDATYRKGDEILDTHDGKHGYWRFNGWDKTGKITVDEDTVIVGTWTFTPNVNVTYEWIGEYPDVELPEDELDIKKGSTHKVDTTYKNGDEVVGTYDGHAGYWRFNGWDKSGTITVDEDTVIKGTWTFTNNVRVYYEWSGEHPEINPPEGDSNFKKGNDYKVETTFAKGTEVLGSKDGKNGYWTFNGWSKTGTITVNEDTLISGDWYFTPNVNVSYEWDGEHPTIDPPMGQFDIRKGSTHNVDTTFVKGVTRVKEVRNGQSGYYLFNGWDKVGAIVVDEDTIIRGTWSFRPLYKIETAAENGDITETITDIEDGETKTIMYTPTVGYQLLGLVVDGEAKGTELYPHNFTFANINADHTIKVLYELTPKLVVTKQASETEVKGGDKVKYTVTVKQTLAGAEARNVRVKDTLPTGFTLENIGFPEGVADKSSSDTDYSFTIPYLRDDEISFSYTVKTSKTMGTHKNTVTAEGDNVPQGAEATASVRTTMPAVRLEKTVDNTNPEYHEDIVYTIVMSQTTENAVLNNAFITDEIPKGIEVKSVEVSEHAEYQIDGNKLKVSQTALSDKMTVRIKGRVVAMSGTITNEAIGGGDDVSSVSADATLTVATPEITLKKTASPKMIKFKAGGKSNSFSFVVTGNITNAPAVGCVIKDIVPAGLEIDEDSIKTNKSANISVKNNTIYVKFKNSIKGKVTLKYKAKPTVTGKFINIAAIYATNHTEKVRAKSTVQALKKLPTTDTKSSTKDNTKESSDSVERESSQTGDGIMLALVIGLGAMICIAIILNNKKK